MRDAKRHNRSVVITLLDLKNAFGEIHHGLIRAALSYHHFPPELISLFNSIYDKFQVTVAVNNVWTPAITVERGVLQGDPSSPLLFNLCFNILMKTLIKKEYNELGYRCEGTKGPRFCSWLQYADDAAIVASDAKNTQALLNLFCAWCEWAGMELRLDKCCSFGMSKKNNEYVQTLPGLWVEGQQIPTIPIGKEFTYLGRLFSFDINGQKTAKSLIIDKLNNLLTITSKLKLRPQTKLKILKLYIHAQLAFMLKMYDLSLTWIEHNLDALVTRHVREWMESPISACVNEIQRLPTNRSGLGIPSFKDVADRSRLQKRHSLMTSRDSSVNQLWSKSSTKNCTTDERLMKHATLSGAMKDLKKDQTEAAWEHIQSLTLQGKSTLSVVENVTTSNIEIWSTTLAGSSTVIHNFARKALIDQLPTNSNLQRWKRAQNAGCTLCNATQTNKHVLSNCKSSIALNRYRARHDAILILITRWLMSVIRTGQTIFADIESPNVRAVRDLFSNLRPDIAVVDNNTVNTWELTVCHETNFMSSKQYKVNKYTSLKNDTTSLIENKHIITHTLEISVLGFVSDSSNFLKSTGLPKLPVNLLQSICRQALNSSFSIYCCRNSTEETIYSTRQSSILN